LAKIGKFPFDRSKRFDSGCGGFYGFRIRKEIEKEITD